MLRRYYIEKHQGAINQLVVDVRKEDDASCGETRGINEGGIANDWCTKS
jgi:hypothetical protein